MTWLIGEHRRITSTNTSPGRPLDCSQWRVINASNWVGRIPRQGTPGTGVGVDCGLFTLAFAMELSLGHKMLEVQQSDILAMRNWIAYTVLRYGKLNGTSELDTPFLSRILSPIAERATSPKVQLSLKRKAPTVLRPRGKIGRPEQEETRKTSWLTKSGRHMCNHCGPSSVLSGASTHTSFGANGPSSSGRLAIASDEIQRGVRPSVCWYDGIVDPPWTAAQNNRRGRDHDRPPHPLRPRTLVISLTSRGHAAF